jgi:uncharacterized phage-associated protein
MTASVFDVAKFVLRETGPISAMKLQKLCFYAQSWHLCFKRERLFSEDFQAWANGPVCYELFDAHRGLFTVTADSLKAGDPIRLDEDAVAIVEAVLDRYSSFSARHLSDMTHAESPWQEARGGLPSGATSSNVISLDLMAEECRKLLAGA